MELFVAGRGIVTAPTAPFRVWCPATAELHGPPLPPRWTRCIGVCSALPLGRRFCGVRGTKHPADHNSLVGSCLWRGPWSPSRGAHLIYQVARGR